MKLNYLTKLNIPGYNLHESEKNIYQFDFLDRDCKLWYQNFCIKMNESVNKKYLPVYRMADGEFIFSVGLYPEYPISKRDLKKWVKYFIKYPQYIVRRLFTKELETCWGEKYSKAQIFFAKKKYIEDLKKISKVGYLALHFNKSPSRFSEQYIKPMIKWFKKCNIDLNQENYIPFYFIYAFLCGEEGKKFLRNRNVLVITSATQHKWSSINNTLINEFNVKTATHLNISSTNSMGEIIDLNCKSIANAEIILVSAGIGSINILSQLNKIKTVCIDSGIFIEILAGLDARSRIFTKPDKMS